MRGFQEHDTILEHQSAMRDLVEQVPINCITLEKLEEEKHKYIGQQ